MVCCDFGVEGICVVEKFWENSENIGGGEIVVFNLFLLWIGILMFCFMRGTLGKIVKERGYWKVRKKTLLFKIFKVDRIYKMVTVGVIWRNSFFVFGGGKS